MAAMIPSILSAAVTLIVCLINNHYQRIETEKKHSETISLITYRLDELSDRVNKHNQLIERTYELEKKAELTEEKIKNANLRIDDLERSGHEQ